MGIALSIQNSADCSTAIASDIQRPVGGRAKRSFDFGVALAALILLFPLFAVLSALIYWLEGGPVLIRHTRVGRGGEKFGCLKFRTMVIDSDKVLRAYLDAHPEAAAEWDLNRKLCSDPRVTKLGLVLRKTSLDELPQVLNILAGDMSFVGPRPIVEEEIGKYGPAYYEYRLARPGLTGVWQINGRNDVDYQKRVAFDQDYVTNWSFRRDLLIILRTIPAVIKARGVY